jgi:hypothetical protein
MISVGHPLCPLCTWRTNDQNEWSERTAVSKRRYGCKGDSRRRATNGSGPTPSSLALASPFLASRHIRFLPSFPSRAPNGGLKDEGHKLYCRSDNGRSRRRVSRFGVGVKPSFFSLSLPPVGSLNRTEKVFLRSPSRGCPAGPATHCDVRLNSALHGAGWLLFRGEKKSGRRAGRPSGLLIRKSKKTRADFSIPCLDDVFH